jgi:methylenetetrahydrofolate reductase (NADPH)
MTNPLRDALASGRFCYVVELVASALTREARLLEAASSLARIPAVVAGSVTSYAGGAMGHDPLRVAAAARARGLTPNIHLTCVSQDRRGLAKSLDDMHALSLENVFALTGDYPGSGDQPPVFDLDSVQLVQLIDERRRSGVPFHIAVAVSPFKYVEADCVYQYVKLEKKIAAGADVAVTQVGWDARKFAELRATSTCAGSARRSSATSTCSGPRRPSGWRPGARRAAGFRPSCLPPCAPKATRKTAAARHGWNARREPSRCCAVLGYAGAYIGGTHDAAQIAWIIRRADELAPRWETLAAELSFGAAGGFYLPTAATRAVRRPAKSADTASADAPRADPASAETTTVRPRVETLPRLLDWLGRAFPVNRDTWVRRALRRVFAWVDRSKPAAALVERVELAIKRPLFGCQACGNCVLGHLEYVCPQTCPKQLRTDRAAGRTRAAARSPRTSRASGSPSMTGPRPPARSTASGRTCRRPIDGFATPARGSTTSSIVTVGRPPSGPDPARATREVAC